MDKQIISDIKKDLNTLNIAQLRLLQTHIRKRIYILQQKSKSVSIRDDDD